MKLLFFFLLIEREEIKEERTATRISLYSRWEEAVKVKNKSQAYSAYIVYIVQTKKLWNSTF